MPNTVPGLLGARLKQMIPPGTTPIQMGETPEAHAYLEAYYYAIKDRCDKMMTSLFSSSFNRAQVYALKLAMIHAIADGRTTIEQGDYEAINPFITTWAETLKNVVERVATEDKFQEQILKADRFLQSHPRTTARHLQQFMKLRQYELKDLLSYLQEAGICRFGTEVGGNGKPSGQILEYVGAEVARKTDEAMLADPNASVVAAPLLRPKVTLDKQPSSSTPTPPAPPASPSPGGGTP